MGSISIKGLIKYWYKTSQHDYETMVGLFRIKRYSASLFFGHIILEKILKALIVKNTKKDAPFIHDLVRLQELTELDLTTEQLVLLKDVNNFNIRCRYPDFKLKFHKLCTKQFTQKYLDKIIKLYSELCQKLSPKK